jgi:Domain of unknown function (DUF1905)
LGRLPRAGPEPGSATVTLRTTFEPLDPTSADERTGMIQGAFQQSLESLRRFVEDSLPGMQLSGVGHARLVHMVGFSGRVRQWRDDKPGGLAVVDIPTDLVADLGGRRQMRVTGNLNGAPFTGSTMLVTGGGLCVGVSKAALTAANASVGDEVQLSITATSS